jgi:endonuclease/exonuclease/phosphatase family metal-dependent hydrolase
MNTKSIRLFVLFTIILLLLPISSGAVKIVTWNILNFPGTTGETRLEDFRIILDEIDPDILIVQEMLSQEGVNEFHSEVLNYGPPREYKKAPFFDGPDTDNAVFYKKAVLYLISNQQIPTPLRDISEYYFKIKKGPGKNERFRLYSVHLKAGRGSADNEKRKEEAGILRDYLNTLPPDSLFMVCGDFNIYTNKEKAFEVLTEDQYDNDGRLKDPIDEVGKWHDKKVFAETHSQSTRKKQFGGGSSGGLDDRFDMFLISYGLAESKKLTYKPGSYLVFGNDGKHLNKSINYQKNKAVSEEMADALYEASDHLPVIIELEPPSEDIPLRPTNLSTSVLSASKIKLTWNDKSDNEDGFKIERKYGSGWIQKATVLSNSTAYSDTGLSANTTYTYRVCAYNGFGDSDYSNKVSATTESGGGGTTVYITETGSKYHRGDCQYLWNSKIPISLVDACNQGYTPCSVCKPPACPSVVASVDEEYKFVQEELGYVLREIVTFAHQSFGLI